MCCYKWKQDLTSLWNMRNDLLFFFCVTLKKYEDCAAQDDADIEELESGECCAQTAIMADGPEYVKSEEGAGTEEIED